MMLKSFQTRRRGTRLKGRSVPHRLEVVTTIPPRKVHTKIPDTNIVDEEEEADDGSMEDDEPADHIADNIGVQDEAKYKNGAKAEAEARECDCAQQSQPGHWHYAASTGSENSPHGKLHTGKTQ
jgi:hypothetical protein